MNVPEGRLVHSRVVADPRDPLAAALDRSLTGYAVFEPQETLLLDAGGHGIVTFRDGVPEQAYYTGTDRGGPSALADLGMPGPYHVELVALDDTALDQIGDHAELAVPPGMPAERLAGDPALAASTRRAAPADRETETPADDDGPDRSDAGAVEAFLDDEAKIDAIKQQARAEAKRRAEEWGFD
ncbi:MULTISPECIES: hypothetical protein [Halomicrobium]|uniref:DUF8054 domain-containing protein n=2 Tax=Halomicrobium mukohataei TaxID=57705 RepID=C7NWD3_HALMD|nr:MULTISPECIES: hypothetical protein [Halomicrobium]ACV46274.1 conserved hypothetical protein [Halomicrobium mukohataei DSM 12286]QCD64834.1 hypothetical protein E5139_03970 [Halomicrobium mukohataei]QFR19641.1 hypothetical protein GBQ70_03970 [Halomicrobium sp. ZPS1]